MNSPAEANRRLIRRLFAAVINAHADDEAGRYYRDDYVQHNPDVPQGLAGVKLLLGMLFEAFPDLRGEIVLELVEQDRVMVVVEWRGTHRGSFAGVAPTQRAVAFRSAEIFRIEDELIAEHWDVVDNRELLLTLGVLSPAS